MYRMGQKPDLFKTCITFAYYDVERSSICENVQLFIRIMPDTLNVAIFKYSLHKFRETILYRKRQLIYAIKTRPFLKVCNCMVYI